MVKYFWEVVVSRGETYYVMAETLQQAADCVVAHLVGLDASAEKRADVCVTLARRLGRALAC